MTAALLTACKWLGTITGIAAGLLVALNLPISGYAFVLGAASSLSWGLAAIGMREWSLCFLQGAGLVINAIGIWRWLL